MAIGAETKAIRLGHPSYVWLRGQDRRLDLIRQYVPLENRRILDVGCGLGMYVRQMRRFSDDVYGVDVDPDKVAQASGTLPHIYTAPAEGATVPGSLLRRDPAARSDRARRRRSPDDRRSLPLPAAGGRIVIYAPNRLYFFETHGFYLGDRYFFRLLPLVNYTPDFIRNRFAPRAHLRSVGSAACSRKLPVHFDVATHVFLGSTTWSERHRRRDGSSSPAATSSSAPPCAASASATSWWPASPPSQRPTARLAAIPSD
jgi:SAM-dependent methyltransferase